MDSLFNGLPLPVYICITLGSAIMMFILAIMAVFRRKSVLLVIGITAMGFTGMSLALVRCYALLNLKWNEEVIRIIPVLFLFSGIVLSLIVIGKSVKNNPTRRKSFIQATVALGIWLLILIVIIVRGILQGRH